MSDETTPQDSAAMPPASAGSHGPVAWWVTLPGRDFPYLSHIQDRAIFCQKEEPGSEVAPLYRSPALTEEEREVLLAIEADAAYRAMWRTGQVVRGLLDRLG